MERFPKIFVEDVFIRSMEEKIFDGLMHFYRFFSLDLTKEEDLNESMDNALHAVKDDIANHFELAGLTYITRFIMRAIDLDKYKSKRNFFESCFKILLDAYREIGLPGTGKQEECKAHIQATWVYNRNMINYYARQHLHNLTTHNCI